MTTPLKIEVTEAMRVAAEDAFCNSSVKFDRNGNEPDLFTPALTAAFQHPEFVRQVREQVLAALPEEMQPAPADYPLAVSAEIGGYIICRNEARASLGRLLGEEGK